MAIPDNLSLGTKINVNIMYRGKYHTLSHFQNMIHTLCFVTVQLCKQ